MMISLANNINRGFLVVAGRIQTVSNLDSSLTIIDNTVRSQLGEYIYKTDKGIDYWDNVFGANPNFQLFESQVRSNVLDLSFVERIESFEYTVKNNTLSYAMNVKTIYGSGVING